MEACYDAIQPGDTPAIVDAKCSVPPQKEASEAGASFERIYEDSKGKARVAFTSGRVVLMTFEGKDASGKPVPGSSRAKS